MSDIDTGGHHHVHGREEYALVADAVRATMQSGVLDGAIDFGVVIERKHDGTLFVYVLPVWPVPGMADGA